MLSPDQVASQGPGGFLNLNGGPTDPYYALSDGTGYATAADACAAVPGPARRNRTVNVGGTDYWWLQSDLSDNGLVLKSVASTGPGGGSPAIYADFIFTAETDGAQSFPMPAGTLGIDGQPAWYQADTKLVDTLGNWDFTGGNLVTYAATDIKAGDKVFGRRYYGGTGGVGGGGPVQAEDIEGVLAPDQLPPLADADIAQLFDLLKPYLDQRYVQR